MDKRTAAQKLGDECAHPTGAEGDPGLTKRELFAAMAMQGLVQHTGTIGLNHGTHEIAKRALQCADALLAELASPPAHTSVQGKP